MSIFYHSTRSCADLVTSKKAITQGIAPDGGLYITDSVAEKNLDLAAVCSMDFASVARLVLGTLFDDFSATEIADCVEAAYGSTFASPEVCPVTPLAGNDWLLELYHGPTCAFKDVALQMLPQLMVRAAASTSADPGIASAIGSTTATDAQNIMIVTATSGDTGKAALAGFANVDNVGITVFYPEGGVSDIQRLQMVTQLGSNVEVCAVQGNFDDVQTQVKRIFGNHTMAKRLSSQNVVLSSANSINIGRLVPQIVYYFTSYAQLVRKGAIAVGDPVEFCVPTGNFGDVLAGYFAKLMGLPASRFVVASNKNDVLTEFLSTGTYNRLRPFHKTISPSMDILVSSNLERLLYLKSGGDTELISYLMHQLATRGSYTIAPELLKSIQQDFTCGSADDAQTRQTIADTWSQQHVLIDTHTAVALAVEKNQSSEGVPRVILSTANPYKFSADVLSALGQNVAGMDGFACMDALQQLTGVPAPEELSALRDASELHRGVCAVDGMADVVEAACSRCFA